MSSATGISRDESSSTKKGRKEGRMEGRQAGKGEYREGDRRKAGMVRKREQ
jgi:hypothetical protein